MNVKACPSRTLSCPNWCQKNVMLMPSLWGSQRGQVEIFMLTTTMELQVLSNIVCSIVESVQACVWLYVCTDEWNCDWTLMKMENSYRRIHHSLFVKHSCQQNTPCLELGQQVLTCHQITHSLIYCKPPTVHESANSDMKKSSFISYASVCNMLLTQSVALRREATRLHVRSSWFRSHT